MVGLFQLVLMETEEQFQGPFLEESVVLSSRFSPKRKVVKGLELLTVLFSPTPSWCPPAPQHTPINALQCLSEVRFDPANPDFKCSICRNTRARRMCGHIKEV